MKRTSLDGEVLFLCLCEGDIDDFGLVDTMVDVHKFPDAFS